jgi:hypothetical protein
VTRELTRQYGRKPLTTMMSRPKWSLSIASSVTSRGSMV